jgi:hypothetical protein
VAGGSDAGFAYLLTKPADHLYAWINGVAPHRKIVFSVSENAIPCPVFAAEEGSAYLVANPEAQSYTDTNGVTEWETAIKLPDGENVTAFPDPVGIVVGSEYLVPNAPVQGYAATYGVTFPEDATSAPLGEKETV